MKVVILAGGLGTRISEETQVKPKPMVEIGEMPIIWHIMKGYSHYGLSDFIVCCGYKSYVIKEFFANLALRTSSVTFDIANNSMQLIDNKAEPWRVTLLETGAESMTGGRLACTRDYLDDEPFCLTYGDGVSDVNLAELVSFHQNHGGLATLTTIKPPGRFGAISLAAGQSTVHSFEEKPDGDGAWVNGGFFVLHPSVLDLIEDEQTVWEQGPLRKLASDGQLHAYRHNGFWQPMDTLRDKNYLESLWHDGRAPWKTW